MASSYCKPLSGHAEGRTIQITPGNQRFEFGLKFSQKKIFARRKWTLGTGTRRDTQRPNCSFLEQTGMGFNSAFKGLRQREQCTDMNQAYNFMKNARE